MGTARVFGGFFGGTMSVCLIGATALVLCFFSSFSAHACSCMPIEDPEAHLEEIDVVFRGEVLKTGRGWLARLFGSGDFDPVNTEFRVTKAYKGISASKVKVSHVLEGSLCGVAFTRGEELLVFAHQDKKKLSTGLCTMIPASLHEEAYMDILETRPPEGE